MSRRTSYATRGCTPSYTLSAFSLSPRNRVTENSVSTMPVSARERREWGGSGGGEEDGAESQRQHQRLKA